MSEYNLDGLIAKVKAEAIKRAETEAQEIIKNAKAKAQQILEQAKRDKEQLLNEAQSEAEDVQTKGKIALKQAAREVSIATKNNLLALFQAVLENEIKASLKPDLYQTIVVHVVESLGNNTSISLPADLEDQVIQSIQQKVSDINSTIEVLKSDELFTGLTVSKTSEGWSYNITAEEVSELLNKQLSKKWLDILNKE